jgi:5-methyltetrahydrofolate--homocysteine methyltransferase
MNPLIAKLAEEAPVVTDGAWGTELQARGLGAGECPDLWNLTHPEEVGAVAAAYVEAGSRIILTNTFRANRIALAAYGLADRVTEINAAGVKLSRRAAGDRALVFASMGPSGKLLAAGDVTESEWTEAFAEQARALADAGADALVVETMADPIEACMAVGATRETGLPVVACMVFDSGRNKDRTMMGTTPEQAVWRLSQAGADVVGANCGCGIEGYIPICERLRRCTDKPIWIKANAGLPEVVEGRVRYRMAAGEFARHARQLVDAGAAFVGGCCGTNPDFIRAVRQCV